MELQQSVTSWLGISKVSTPVKQVETKSLDSPVSAAKVINDNDNLADVGHGPSDPSIIGFELPERVLVKVTLEMKILMCLEMLVPVKVLSLVVKSRLVQDLLHHAMKRQLKKFIWKLPLMVT